MILVSTSSPNGLKLDSKLEQQLLQVTNFCLKKMNLTRFKAVIDIIVPKKYGYLAGGVGGYCSASKDEGYFEIQIDLANTRRGEMISTLCHELVHAKQYLKGELCHNSGTKWKGKTYKVSPKDTFALNTPWEREAYKTEDILFNQLKNDVDFEWIKRYNCDF